FAWAIFFAALFTMLNLRGIETSARINAALAAAMAVVIAIFLVVAIRYLIHFPPQGAHAFWKPFYDPQTFSPSLVFRGTSIAVLTYIGFDGISTLSEEVHNPRRNVLLATVLVCLITGVLASLEVYTAQLAWPKPASTFPSLENAFSHVAGRVAWRTLFIVVTAALSFATIGSGMGAHLDRKGVV